MDVGLLDFRLFSLSNINPSTGYTAKPDDESKSEFKNKIAATFCPKSVFRALSSTGEVIINIWNDRRMIEKYISIPMHICFEHQPEE